MVHNARCHISCEQVPIDREGIPSGHRISISRLHDFATSQTHFPLELPDGIRFILASKAIGTNQFGQMVTGLSRCALERLHFM